MDIEVSLSPWLDGAAHVARASHQTDRGAFTSTACGYTAGQAHNRGLRQARIRNVLASPRLLLAQHNPVAGCREIMPSDLVSGVSTDIGHLRLKGHGADSGDPYLVPANSVIVDWTASTEGGGGIQQTMIGATCAESGDPVALAVADIVRRDFLVRWWSQPRGPFSAATQRLEDVLGSTLMAATVQAGFRLSAFRWNAAAVPVVIVALHDQNDNRISFGSGAAARVDDALTEGFLDALRAKVDTQIVLDLGPDRSGIGIADQVYLLAAWLHGSERLSRLNALCSPPSRGRTSPNGDRGVDWIDVACRRFGHEPVVVRCSDLSDPSVIKVVCPGAALYRPVRLAAFLPSPVR